MELERTLYSLEYIKERTILPWISHFEKTVKLCGWPEAEALQILGALVADHLYVHIEKATTVSGSIDNLLLIAFPRRHTAIYQAKLKSTKQKNFTYINDYDQSITSNVEKLMFCLQKKSDEYVDKKIEEYFKEGQDPITRLDIIRAKAEPRLETITLIRNAEEEIIRQNASNTNRLYKGIEQFEKTKGTWCPHHHTRAMTQPTAIH